MGEGYSCVEVGGVLVPLRSYPGVLNRVLVVLSLGYLEEVGCKKKRVPKIRMDGIQTNERDMA